MASLRFLGVGSGADANLGCSAAVFETTTHLAASSPHHAPSRLLIDCGYGVLTRYQQSYGELPNAIYISHLHFDHMADLQALFYHARFSDHYRPTIYIAAELVPRLCQLLDQGSATLAEGGSNLWQFVALVPVVTSFWFADQLFHIHPTRHHAPRSCFALALRGQFFFSADTRPIPEIIQHELSGNELIFHDCRLTANPSHTGLSDLAASYSPATQQRLVLYHYLSKSEAEQLQAAGYKVAAVGERFNLSTLPTMKPALQPTAIGER